MENPCLTFIISSILESQEFLLIDVIHEIAHGWFGNAVTNATWEEMWLSEGLATYAQRRITTEVYGTHTYEHVHTQHRSLKRTEKRHYMVWDWATFRKLFVKLDVKVFIGKTSPLKVQ